MYWYALAFKNFGRTVGRSSRKELLIFCLFNFAASFLMGLIDGLFGLYSERWLNTLGIGYLSFAYMVIVFVPSICLMIRRLHDVNRRGVWLLALLVPLLNIYVIYLLYLKRGSDGENIYGPPPVHGTAAAAPPAEAQDNYLSCPKCASRLPEGSLFCQFCGSKL